jgi:hypothetical protein
VHDFFGHVKEGLGFRAAGEENAWRGHATMYSPLARRALVTDLRGQNCSVNRGPYGGLRTAKLAWTTRSMHRRNLGLMPNWVAWEGSEDEFALSSAGC